MHALAQRGRFPSAANVQNSKTIRRQPSGRAGEIVRPRSANVVCSAKAAELLSAANTKYQAKDLMGAMKLYEDVLAEQPTTRQRQAALFGTTAVHAAFGDVELAQLSLKEGLREGLDFEQALSDPDMVDIVSSVQVLIQLKRFSQQQQLAALRRAATPPSRPAPPVRPFAARAAAPPSSNPLRQDLGSFVGSSTSDTAGVDTSVGAVVRRVALLLLVLVGLGTALFFVGLQVLFPAYE